MIRNQDAQPVPRTAPSPQNVPESMEIEEEESPTPIQRVPTYSMSPSLFKVEDVWKEWTRGLGGRISIEELDQTYGPSWRKSAKERKFYSRRKAIINAIKSLVQEENINAIAAVDRLEQRRQQLGKSLDAFQRLLAAEKRQRANVASGSQSQAQINSATSVNTGSQST